MKKAIFILGLLCFLVSCGDIMNKYPKCGDEDVKKVVLEILEEQLEPELIKIYMDENINENDIYEYASTNGISYSKVLEEEKAKLDSGAKIYVKKVINDFTLENILTSKLDKEIRKCDCEVTIKSKFIEEIKGYYTAQYNDKGDLYVELLYEEE